MGIDRKFRSMAAIFLAGGLLSGCDEIAGTRTIKTFPWGGDYQLPSARTIHIEGTTFDRSQACPEEFDGATLIHTRVLFIDLPHCEVFESDIVVPR